MIKRITAVWMGIALLLAGCDDCARTACEQGFCDDGLCVCDLGFEGVNCEVERIPQSVSVDCVVLDVTDNPGTHPFVDTDGSGPDLAVLLQTGPLPGKEFWANQTFDDAELPGRFTYTDGFPVTLSNINDLHRISVFNRSDFSAGHALVDEADFLAYEPGGRFPRILGLDLRPGVRLLVHVSYHF